MSRYDDRTNNLTYKDEISSFNKTILDRILKTICIPFLISCMIHAVNLKKLSNERELTECKLLFHV